MCHFIENRPPQSYYWDRDALVHLQSDLHRSRAEFSQLLNSEAEHPAFDPFTVRNLIRETRGSGHTPTNSPLFATLSDVVSGKNLEAQNAVTTSWASLCMKMLAPHDSN